MRATLHCLVVLFLLHAMLCLDGISSRHLHPNHDFAVNNNQGLAIFFTLDFCFFFLNSCFYLLTIFLQTYPN